VRIFHKKWRQNLEKSQDYPEGKSGQVNPYTLRRGQVPLEFFKKLRNAQEKRKYIKKYSEFLPRETRRSRDFLAEECEYEIHVRDPKNSLSDLKEHEYSIASELNNIKRANVRKRMEELLRYVRSEIRERERKNW